MIAVDTIDSPIGPLTVAERGVKVCLLHFGGTGPAIDRTLERWYPGETRARREVPGIREVLTRYFGGDVAAIDTVAVELNGSDFQKRVWQALRRIPHGSTLSYGALARRIGAPAAVRAVGTANGSNPIALIVPCHRVIGSDGTLTGYGGGLDRKAWLLKHEHARWNDGSRTAPTLPW
jgi:methylated-DNA-[protein]-cysteine S-methyltransferase